jgi:FeS assembly SUF system protein
MIDFTKLSEHLQEQPTDQEELKARVIGMLRTIYDPEIPVNIYDLGLIYELEVNAAGEVHVRMTLTAPNCPVAEGFPDIVQAALWRVDGVSDVAVELVWEPPWGRENMSEAARLQLGML